MIEVKRLSDDGLSAKIWEFAFSATHMGPCLVLREYTEGTRETTRHKFKGPSWYYMDERSYRSKLPRPTSIPKDVIDEAMSYLEVRVCIGWTNAESVIDVRRAA